MGLDFWSQMMNCDHSVLFTEFLLKLFGKEKQDCFIWQLQKKNQSLLRLSQQSIKELIL